MRYVFIVNPKTNAAKMRNEIKSNLHRIFEGKKVRYKIIESKYVGHITEIVSEEAKTGDDIRVYGFGGDGTLNEMVKGVGAHQNVEVGIFPLGSGNDYIKSYGDISQFLDYDAQIKAKSVKVDLISTLNGDAINICSAGFDAEVGYRMKNYKNLPFVSGPMSYDISVARSLIGKLGENLKVTLHSDGEVHTFEDRYLFVLAASGQYYGGGYKSAPQALTDDGLLDFILIKVPPLHKILSLIGLFKRGEHLENKKFDEFLTFMRGTKIEVHGEKPFYCTRDGECDKVNEEVFSLSENKLKFILPSKLEEN